MPDNIYPDLSNAGFDIKYNQLKILPSDVRSRLFNSGQVTSIPVGSPQTGDSGGDDNPAGGGDSGGDSGVIGDMRFAVAGEDDTADENRSFDLVDAFYFQFTKGADILMKLLSTTGQLILGKYGVGTFVDNTSDWMLGADASGNVYERIVKGTTYSPVIIMIQNLSQAYISFASYLRIGNMLQVSILFELYPTSGTGESILTVDLPVPTTIFASTLVFGSGAAHVPSTGNKSTMIANIDGIGTATVATIKFDASSTAATFANIQFQYLIG